MRTLKEVRYLAHQNAYLYVYVSCLLYILCTLLYFVYKNESIRNYLQKKYGVTDLFVARMYISTMFITIMSELTLYLKDGTVKNIILLVLLMAMFVLMAKPEIMFEEDKK